MMVVEYGKVEKAPSPKYYGSDTDLVWDLGNARWPRVFPI